MKIAFIASECTPIAKVGGLGDVIGALPKALQKLDVEPVVVLPYYRFLESLNPRYLGELGDCRVYETTLTGTSVQVVLLRHEMFWRDEVYGGNDQLSFVKFSNLAAQYISNNHIELAHCHDWHTALVAVLLKNKVPTLLTIHNVHPGTGLGVIGLDQLEKLGVRRDTILVNSTENTVNLLLQGILQADFVTTVSPTHAQEIQTEEFGAELAPILKSRAEHLTGVINGIDTEVFNPNTDKNIVANYSADDLMPKQRCKTDLEQAVNLPTSNSLLAGVVTRLTGQKGVDLLAEVLPRLAQKDLRMVILGTGEKGLESQLGELEKQFPNHFRAILRFDAKLAQKIYAGSDVFLMPSRFEPCGLGQMIAMRYGTLPIVHRTGGLADTVEDGRTGYVFAPLNQDNLFEAIIRAQIDYNNSSQWQTLQRRAMAVDFSWEQSAKKYLEIYQRLTTR